MAFLCFTGGAQAGGDFGLAQDAPFAARQLAQFLWPDRDALQPQHPKAKRFARISYIDALQKRLKVMDSTAFSLCMDNGMPIIVFDLFKKHNFRKVILGGRIGTLVS